MVTALGLWLIIAMLAVLPPVLVGYAVFVEPTLESLGERLIELLPLALTLLLGLMLTVLITVKVIFGRRVREPLLAFAVKLERVRASGKPDGEFDHPLDDEIGRLVARYNALVKDFQQAQQRYVDPQGSLLAANQQTYRDAFQQSPAILLLFQPDTLRIVEVNRAAESFYGLSREALLEMTLEGLLHPPSSGQLTALSLQFAAARDASEPCYQIHRHADGQPRRMEYWVSSLVNEHEDRLGCAAFRDVSEHHSQLSELEEQARYLRETEEITATGHWFLGSDGQMRWSSEGYRIHGVSPENFDSTLENTFRLLHPEDRQGFRSTLQRAMRQDEAFTIEARVRPLGARERLIQYRGKALKLGQEGTRRGILAVFNDVTERRELEQRLREQERIQQQAARLARLGSFVWDLNAERYRFCSQEMASIFGSTQDEFIRAIDCEQALIERIHPEDQLNYMRKRDQAARERQPYEVEFRIRDPLLGEWRQLLELGEVVSDDGGQAQRLVGSTQDISRLKAMEDKLRQETSFRSQAAKLAMLGTFVWDLSEDRCFFCSGELATIYGLTTTEEYTEQFSTIALLLAQVHPEDRQHYLNVRQGVHNEGDQYQIEYRLINCLGRERYVAEIAQVLNYGSGRLRVVGSVQDISDKKRREEELQRLATTDELTGVFNRRHFMHLGGESFMSAKRQSKTLSVLMMDIDHFKSINTRFEHAGGDTALQAFTRCCQSVLRNNDVFGRLGGEEFAVLLPDTDAEKAHDVAEHLCRRVSRLKVIAPPGAREAEFSFTVSIGVATASSGDASIDQVVLRADSALFAAKDGGRNRVQAQIANLAGEGG